MKTTKFMWISLVVLLGISALAYLPLVHRIGYINDDWYLMYDARVYGGDFFHDIFSIDRPLRGYVMQAAFSLFGLNSLPYHLSAYLFRVLSGFGFLWVCSQLWPMARKWNLFATVLFMIYPGFLSQINPIDYQSQIISLACGIFSIGLTVKAIQSGKTAAKWIFTILSILLVWIYLGLVEYFIGFEVFRLACIVIIYMRQVEYGILARLRGAFYSFIAFGLGVGGFLIWRFFLFSSERKATDLSFQISSLFLSPLTVLWWLNYLVQDVLKIVVHAWSIPLDALAFSLRLRDTYSGILITVMSVILFLLFFHRLDLHGDENRLQMGNDSRDRKEGVWLALTAIISGVLPVIMVNRHVIFPDYSRYALASSIGVAILMSIVVRQITSRKFLFISTSFFIAVSVFTHFGNSVKAAQATDEVKNFWWQVAWRAPQIKSGTTLSVTYPTAAIQEDYFIWGAANHIYYPETKKGEDLQVDLAGIVLNEYTVSRILVGRGEDSFRKRGDILVVNEYDRILVITQADVNSCVRILDGASPDLSLSDQHRVMLVAPHSKLETLVDAGNFSNPPEEIFGDEPRHDWCYYYQKADLARQRGNWQDIVSLYESAVKNDYRPNDQIELMPFLQAYALLGDQKMVRDISTRINTQLFYRQQACQKFVVMSERGYPLAPEMQNYVDELFCQ